MTDATELDEAAIRARVEAATPGPWHWAGNTDTGEPYLATWLPGIGRCSVLAIGEEARKTTGREADRVRSDAQEFDLGDPEELVHDWATDRFGEPIKDPRLWFYTDLMADPARDHVVYEVAPDATSREDRRVYRADITGIRHPDAEFIAHARTDLPAALDEITRLRAALDEARAEVERVLEASACNHDAKVRWFRRAEAAESAHRDLVSRLGFGDDITEPMADNDTVVAWFEQQSRDANEWQESQLWRNDCYVAGHPDDEDCWEHDPTLRLQAAESALAAVRALADEWTESSAHHPECAIDEDCVGCAADELRAALATPTTTERSESKAESALTSIRTLARSWSGRHDLLMTGDSAAHDIEAALATPTTTDEGDDRG